MAKIGNLTLTIDVNIQIKLWSAIKMRIAGKYLGDYLEKLLKNNVEKKQEIDIDLVTE